MDSPWGDKEQNRFNKKINFDGGMPNFNLSLIISCGLIVVCIIWLISGVYQVKQGEQAAVMRFGKFNRISNPGLNYHIPKPFESVEIVQIQKSRRLEIGYKSQNGITKGVPEQSIMLTGDQNIVDLKVDVMWHVSNLADFVYNVRFPSEVVGYVAQSSIREVIGETPISDALSSQKQEIANKIEVLMQGTVDKYKAGIKIERVELLEAEPPLEVINSYRDVQTAKADKEKVINQAYAYANNILPQARGEREKILQNAEAYRSRVISQAEGDASKFNQIYKQYLFNKIITKKRIYLDTVSKILHKTNKVIVDSGDVLNHLPLNSLIKNKKL